MRCLLTRCLILFLVLHLTGVSAFAIVVTGDVQDIDGSVFDMTTLVTGDTYTYNTVILQNAGQIIGGLGDSLNANVLFDFRDGSSNATLGGSGYLEKSTTGTVTLSGTVSVPVVKILGGTLIQGGNNVLDDGIILYLDNSSGDGSLYDLGGYSDLVKYVFVHNGATLGTGVSPGSLIVEPEPNYAGISLSNGGVLNADVTGTVVKNTALLSSGTAANILNGLATVGTVAIVGGSSLQLGGHERIYNSASLYINGASSALDLNVFSETVQYALIYNSAGLAGSGTLNADQYVLKGVTLPGTVLLGGNAANDAALFVIGGSTSTLNGTADVASVSIDGGSTLDLGASERIDDGATLFVEGAGSLLDLGTFDETVRYAYLYNGATLSGSGSLIADQHILKGAILPGSVTLGGQPAYNSALFVIGGVTSTLNGVAEVSSASVSGGSTLLLGARERLYNGATLYVEGTGSVFDLAGFDETVQYAYLYNSASLQGSGMLAADQYILKDGLVQAELSGNATYNSSLFAVGGSSLLDESATVRRVMIYNGAVLQLGASGVLPDTESLIVEGAGSLFDLNGQVVSVDDLRLYNSASLASTTPGGRIDADQYVLKDSDVDISLGSVAYNTALFAISGTNVLYNAVTVQNVSVNGGATLQLGTGGALVDTETLFVEGAGSLFDTNGQVLGIDDLRLYNSASLASTIPGGRIDSDQYVLKDSDVDIALGSVAYNTALFAIGGTNVLYNSVTVQNVSVDGGATLQLGASGALVDTETLFVEGAGSLFDLNGQVLSIEDLRLYNSASLASTAPGGRVDSAQYVLKDADVDIALGSVAYNTALFAIGGANVLYNSVTVQNVSVDGGASLQLGTGGALVDTETLFVEGAGSTFDLNGQVLSIDDLRLYNSASLMSTVPGGRVDSAQYVLKASDVDISLGSVAYNTALFAIGGTNVLYNSVTVQNVSVDGGATLQLGTGGALVDTETLFVEGAGSTFDLNGQSLIVQDARLYNSATFASTTPGGELFADQYVLKGADVTMDLPGNATYNASLFAIGGTSVLYNTVTVEGVSVTDGSVLRLGASELLQHYNSTTLSMDDDVQLYVDASTFDMQGYDETLLYAGFYNGSTLSGTGTLYADQYVLDGADIFAPLGGNAIYNATLFVTGGVNNLSSTATIADVSITGGATLSVTGANLLQNYNAVSLLNEPVTRVYMNSSTLDLQADQTLGFVSGSGDILLGGVLTTGNDESTEFSGVISGPGSLVKEGEGFFFLSGDSTYVGPTTINTGHLVVNGSLSSDVVVGADGNLWGDGVIAGTVVNDGNVLPGNSIGTLTVDDYVSNVGSVLTIEVDAFGGSDQLIVNNVATLNGGTVEVFATGNGTDYTSRQFHYIVLDATGGVVGTFDDVTSNVAELTPELIYDDAGNLVELLLTRNNINYATLAGSLVGNHIAVSRVLSKADSTSSGDLSDILNHYVDDLDREQRQQALEELGGQKIYTAVPMASIGLLDAFNGAIGQRLSRLHGLKKEDAEEEHPLDRIILSLAGEEVSDVSPVGDDGRKNQGVWLHLYGREGDIDQDENAVGYDYDLHGAAGGIDFRIGDGLSVGLTAGYGVSNVDTEMADDAEIDSVQAGIYSSYDQGDFYLDGLVSIGFNSNDVDRSITFGKIARSTEADYDALEWSAAAELGYVTRFDNLVLQPFVSSRYIQLEEDGFTDRGAGDISLKLDDRTTQSWTLSPGMRMSRPVRFGAQGLFLPELSVKWVRELADDAAEIKASFVGAPDAGHFKVHGVQVDRNSLDVDAGVRLLLSEVLQMSLNLGFEYNRDRTTHRASGGLLYLW